MRLPYLLSLFTLGLSIAGLALWAMEAPPDNYVSVTSPPVLHYQLGLLVTGPSPDLKVTLFGYSFVTGATVQLLHLDAPLWVLLFVLVCIAVVMLDDAIPRRRKPTTAAVSVPLPLQYPQSHSATHPDSDTTR